GALAVPGLRISYREIPVALGKARGDAAGPLQRGDRGPWLAFLQVLEPEAGPVVRIRRTARLEPSRHHLCFVRAAVIDQQAVELVQRDIRIAAVESDRTAQQLFGIGVVFGV